MNTKYVVIEGKMIIFPDCGLTHADVAHKLLKRDELIESAGFISFDMYGNPSCYGKSVSLNIMSRPDKDGQLAKKLMGRDNDYLVTAEQYHKAEAEKAKLWDEHCAKQGASSINFLSKLLGDRQAFKSKELKQNHLSIW